MHGGAISHLNKKGTYKKQLKNDINIPDKTHNNDYKCKLI